jgi:cyclic di-GMP phosphodiesterase
MKPRLLIVDDEPMIREVLTENLKGAGYECEAAAGAAQAMERLGAGNGIGLVLADIDMPGESGMVLLGRIKEQYPDIDVIMVTGVVDIDIAIQAIRMGASDYITKPFNLDQIVLIVNRTLQQRQLIIENRRYQKNLESLVQERT